MSDPSSSGSGHPDLKHSSSAPGIVYGQDGQQQQQQQQQQHWRQDNNRKGSSSKSRSPTRSVDGETSDTSGRPQPNYHRNSNKSRSPTRNYNHNNKSLSPSRRSADDGGNNHHSNHHHHHHYHHHNNHQHHHHHHYNHHSKGKHRRLGPSAMTVIVNRIDLWDSAAHFQPEDHGHYHHSSDLVVLPYCFEGSSNGHSSATTAATTTTIDSTSVALARVPYSSLNFQPPEQNHIECQNGIHHRDVIDTSIPNPHDPSVVHDKYWAQRRRLFSRFDRGIQLDSEGWYSVTPEIIADHVAHRIAELAIDARRRLPLGHHLASEGIILLDAFCGCGGNTIAFGKLPSPILSKVVCVDTDRTKLRKAAHNASIYEIPPEKLVFVECNSIFILQHCYKDGEFVLDKPTATLPKHMPAPVSTEIYAGYQLGGLDLLPRRIDAVFMDPPWGGIDYEILGKNGYDLEKNMKIQVGPASTECEEEGGISDDFFDTFTTHQPVMSQKQRKANFNKKMEGEFINGVGLLKLAAEATSSRIVAYDLPRNTNKTSLGKSALAAGYRGNIKLEEHYLNGRLKTVTAYMGSDYTSLIQDLLAKPQSGDEATAKTV